MFINYEREIIMKIEVGPAELLPPLHIASPCRKKMPRIAAHSSLGGDANANLESQKAQQRMHLERCHGAAPFIWMV